MKTLIDKRKDTCVMEKVDIDVLWYSFDVQCVPPFAFHRGIQYTVELMRQFNVFEVQRCVVNQSSIVCNTIKSLW